MKNKKLISLLKKWASKHNGTAPSIERWNEDKALPNADIYIERFGGWKSALRMAGLIKQTAICNAQMLRNNNSEFCVYCSDFLTIENTTIEHLIPVVRGGHKYSTFNLAKCCRYCNSEKGELKPIEYLTLLLNKRVNTFSLYNKMRIETKINNIRQIVDYIYMAKSEHRRIYQIGLSQKEWEIIRNHKVAIGHRYENKNGVELFLENIKSEIGCLF